MFIPVPEGTTAKMVQSTITNKSLSISVPTCELEVHRPTRTPRCSACLPPPLPPPPPPLTIHRHMSACPCPHP